MILQHKEEGELLSEKFIVRGTRTRVSFDAIVRLMSKSWQ